ncbi:14704_t:CDS:1, partial [Funneliformis caledonium]
LRNLFNSTLNAPDYLNVEESAVFSFNVWFPFEIRQFQLSITSN